MIIDGQHRRPDFMIVGAMKAATSTLHEQLARQPGIFMSTPKEPCFFSDDDVYAQGLAWYEQLFVRAPTDSLCGESSTHYTKLPTYPNTLDRIESHAPDARFVYVMRHPIDRLVSQLVHAISEGKAPTDPTRAIVEVPELIDYSRYAYQVRPFLDRFGSERVLPVAFDRVNAVQGPAVLDEVLTFLGRPAASPSWAADGDQQNAGAQRLRPNALRDRLVDNPLLRTLRRRLVPKSVRERVAGIWAIERPELSDELRSELEGRFDADLALLGEWLGIDGLSCSRWKALMTKGPLQWTATAGRVPS